ncbi:hypothetical protein BX589_102328 [Paraburkholderia fungorum]|uniref:hypothetical protein n=1 Tax=Paraburkholderia fungorum TaxID=134537 RepID=UPI000D079647|nr:hypothetical protein [Paraburkholderia fungorum]PRZ56127.1 hypothetical protein BX589_102328 [Paraburkholderia fungorum]
MTDDEILNEFERRAIGVPLRLAGVPNLDGVRIIEGVRALLSATQPAAVDRGATPVAWLIDPGAGSAVDRFQQVEPYGWQYDEVEKRGGSITLLYAAPLDKDASKPVAYPSEHHDCVYSNGDGVCEECKALADAHVSLIGEGKSERASPAAPSVEQDERGAYPVVLTNDELNALTKERFGNMHAMYAEGFRRLMRTAIEANSKKARAVSTSANVAQDAEAVVLQHVAVAEDGGKLRWMTGRRPRDCELYAMPDGGRIPPKLYGAPPEQTALTDDARGAVLTEIRHAISDYHFALDLRAHGGIAQDHAFNTICKSLGMHWKQGEETARRALTAAQSASGG